MWTRHQLMGWRLFQIFHSTLQLTPPKGPSMGRAVWQWVWEQGNNKKRIFLENTKTGYVTLTTVKSATYQRVKKRNLEISKVQWQWENATQYSATMRLLWDREFTTHLSKAPLGSEAVLWNPRASRTSKTASRRRTKSNVQLGTQVTRSDPLIQHCCVSSYAKYKFWAFTRSESWHSDEASSVSPVYVFLQTSHELQKLHRLCDNP